MYTYVHCSVLETSKSCRRGITTNIYWVLVNMYVTVYNSKDLEPTQMPINDRLDEENVAHIQHGILCSHKKNEFMSFAATRMKLEPVILSKITQEQKTKHHMFSLISGS